MKVPDSVRQEFLRRLGPVVRLDEPLWRHTSFRIGGPADLWVEARTTEEVQTTLGLAALYGVPVTVLGAGTNVLVSDRGVRGVVLRLGRPFAVLEWPDGEGGMRVRAGAAGSLRKLVRAAVERSLEGLEFAEGIPGTVGGGLLMNAGAFGGDLGSVVEAVHGVESGGEARVVPKESLRFGYRRMDLPEGFVVTFVEFRLRPGDPSEIRARMEEARSRRRNSQPRGKPNAGSIFKNPQGTYAGRLIEEAGLKGARRGGAMISTKHANFIVNLGSAKAEDVRALMEEARLVVEKRFGIRLEPEVRLVGEWD